MTNQDPTITNPQNPAADGGINPPAPSPGGGANLPSNTAPAEEETPVGLVPDEKIFPSVSRDDLNYIFTYQTNRPVSAFNISAELLEQDCQLVDLVIRCESMKDKDRQYWLDLTKTMTTEQKERLREILMTERRKLANIRKKYGKDYIDEVQKNREAAKQKAIIDQKKAELQNREKTQQQAEQAKEDALLSELENL